MSAGIKSNGQDMTEPLGQRTAPLGRFGVPRGLVEQAREPAPTNKPSLWKPSEERASEWLKSHEANLQSVAASVHRKMSITVFRSGGKQQASPFVPERVTGPVQFVSKLLEVWNLNASDAIPMLGFEQEDGPIVDSILAGRSSLRGRDSKDRIAALFRVRSLLAELFRDIDAERAWLRTARPEFGGRSPVELLRQGSMESLLTLRQFVEHISGQ